jgi:hypothetical protein
MFLKGALFLTSLLALLAFYVLYWWKLTIFDFISQGSFLAVLASIAGVIALRAHSVLVE